MGGGGGGGEGGGICAGWEVADGEGDVFSIALFEPFFLTCTDNTKLLALPLGTELMNNIEFMLNCYTNYCTYIKLIIFLHIKTLRHVSVLGPSSGSHIVVAKVTL